MNRVVRFARVAAVLIILAAITTDAARAISLGTFEFFNFFGYFTIQTNLIGATALGLAVAHTGRERPRWLEYLRASATVYLVIVTTVYWTLLAPTSEPDVVWTNLVLHLFSGIFVLADWLVEGPRHSLPASHFWVVLLYPAAWLTVVLIRGATDGWVPYPFLEPGNGYASVAIVVGGILAVGTILALLIFRSTRWRLVTP
ncbi:Pr6Pr family membrane protein [Demequina oxidasica]|uniref:Pr6Pr family membrane protein n=1 Tax=Demequina oxidasica TaxID=676199 RepID=UPI00128D2D7B|nr:Pr6Pr family membrane protein [Demequina oxidasica]